MAGGPFGAVRTPVGAGQTPALPLPPHPPLGIFNRSGRGVPIPSREGCPVSP